MEHENETLDKVVCGLEKENGLFKPNHMESYVAMVDKHTCYDSRDCFYKQNCGNTQYCKFYENTISKDEGR